MINTKDRLLAASRQYMHNNLGRFVEGYNKAEIAALVGELEAERDTALTRVEELEKALKAAEFTKCMNASCRETSPRFCPVCMRNEEDPMCWTGIPQHTEYCLLGKALEHPTLKAPENKEDSPEDLTVPFGRAKIANVMRELKAGVSLSCLGCSDMRKKVESFRAERDAALGEIDGLKEDLADLLHAAKCFLGAMDFGDGMTRVKTQATLRRIIARVEDN